MSDESQEMTEEPDMNSVETSERGDELAIIGMSCRFPKAGNAEQFWERLRDGVELITTFSDEELLAEGVSRELLGHPNFVKAGGFMEGIELFDASFFGYSPREAELLDPQQRQFLECAWEALENAGYEPGGDHGLVGVFAGTSNSNYLWQNLTSHPELLDAVGNFQVGMLNDKDYLTTRVSYKLNLKGPSVSVQTACSTSLVAIHLACQSVLNGECDMALAGGVSISILRKYGYIYSEGGISSPDGHCRAFDARGQGIVGGNGVGLVVIKRLEDAMRDGDNILAVIKGSAVNNDGSVKIGYTAPSVEGQVQVIAQAQAVAAVEADSITYVEAHGTGTALGDPIEVMALTKCFRATTEEKGFCGLGSVKTNLGHLDVAAGVAGVIKTVLSLQHRMLPPSLHFETPNPRIDFANSPFYVNSRLTQWPEGPTPRRAGVSSFGIGGTNAHAILEEAPVVEPSSESRPWQLLVLSAKTPCALEAASRNLACHLRTQADLKLADVAYTLQVGRKLFEHRRALVCRDLEDAAELLERPDSPRVATASQDRQNQPIVFMFTGQGSQYPNMGAGLYEHEPTFREHVDRCAELLKPLLGLDVREVIYPAADATEEAARSLRQTSMTQPALFVVEYALARLLMEWGIRPTAMIGHSIGEYVAACLAGVFSLEDALGLVVERGRLMQGMPAGSMLSVNLNEDEVAPFLGAGLDLAAVNAPSQCVVAGPAGAIDELQKQLSERGHESTRLHTSHAFHSEMMRPVLAPFTERLRVVKLHAPRLPFISNVTGTWITATEATDPNYWARHLAGTVRFAEGVRVLKESGAILLEVGPGQTLSALARQQLQGAARQTTLCTLRPPRESHDDVEFLLKAVGRLWLAGVRLDWAGFYTAERRRRVPLPTYPFERERYWIEPRVFESVPVARPRARGKLPQIADWFYTPLWKQSPPRVSSAAREKAPEPSRWLVFADEHELGTCLIEQLRAKGDEVVSVRAGEQFARLEDGDYVINPLERDDYQTLLKELRADERMGTRLVHLWSARPAGDRRADGELFEAAQSLGLYSLLFLAQALAGQGHNSPLQLGVVSSGAQDLSGAGPLAPERATLLAACKVIPQEYPNITCRSIDIEMHASGDAPMSKFAARLIDEMESQSPDLVVAYRNSRRWTQTFEPVRLEAAAAPDARGRLREQGVYLIAEGAGRISLLLAEHLARAVAAKIVFLSRSDFPEREAWEQWLATHGAEDESSVRIRRLLALEALGAEVMIVRAEVTSREQMTKALGRVRERFGRLDGIIYAAPIDGEEPRLSVQETSLDECRRRFVTNLGGLFVLAELLRDEKPDFCLLMSSLSAVLGGLGLLCASAEGAFMNGFAAAQNQAHDVSWISLNWDAWLLPEDGTGEEASDLRGHATLGINSAEGLEVLGRVLAHAPFSPVAVSTGDLSERLAQWINLESVRDHGEAKKNSTLSLHPRPNLTEPYVAPRNETESAVVQIWQTLLGIEPIGVNDSLFNLGGDSLLAVQITSRVREALHVEVAVRSVFEKPTIAGLVESIEQSRQAAGADMDRLAEVVDLVEQLSEEELLALLAEQESETSEV